MCKAMLATTVDGEDDYFEGIDEAMARYPLTLLDDLRLGGVALELISRNFGHYAGTYYLSLLDVVASFLCPSLLTHMGDYRPGWSNVQRSRRIGLS